MALRDQMDLQSTNIRRIHRAWLETRGVSCNGLDVGLSMDSTRHHSTFEMKRTPLSLYRIGNTLSCAQGHGFFCHRDIQCINIFGSRRQRARHSSQTSPVSMAKSQTIHIRWKRFFTKSFVSAIHSLTRWKKGHLSQCNCISKVGWMSRPSGDPLM